MYSEAVLDKGAKLGLLGRGRAVLMAQLHTRLPLHGCPVHQLCRSGLRQVCTSSPCSGWLGDVHPLVPSSVGAARGLAWMRALLAPCDMGAASTAYTSGHEPE